MDQHPGIAIRYGLQSNGSTLAPNDWSRVESEGTPVNGELRLRRNEITTNTTLASKIARLATKSA